MGSAVSKARARRVQVAIAGKLATATVLKQKRRPLEAFELMKRGHLNPKGVSPKDLPYIRLYATQMVRKFQQLDRKRMAQDMTPEEKQWFEEEILRNQGRAPSENFALLALDLRRLDAKVATKDQLNNILELLNKRLPPSQTP